MNVSIVQSLNYLISTTIHTKDVDNLKNLVSRYGSRLERLDNESKLGFVATLTRYLYIQSLVEEYSITDAITDTFLDLDESICTVLSSLQGLSSQNINLLIDLVRTRQNSAGLMD